AYFQQKAGDWQEPLMQAIELARRYRFYRKISEEGAAIWKMMQDKTFRTRFPKGDPFVKTLYGETEQMARRYPLYLDASMLVPPEFGGNALKILQLQAEGKSYAEIAGVLGIKEETVKYHCRENYKKLGVSGKASAILAARELKLL
ncbi:MAG: helix-turn-helix transcriptional regulator, partial [Hungatella sp.]